MKKDKSNKLSKRTVSGQPADEIVLNPNDKAEKKLSEAITDTAVITFGRMNPPTVGHLSLVEKMLDIALENKAYPLIYLSHTYDPKKNPLSYDEKFELVREAFGDYVQRSEANNPIAVLKEVSERFKNVIVVVGEDRVKDLVRITETYNGKDFNFDNTEVISAGLRDPDAEGVEGMSASKMRELAIEGNLTKFREGLPTQLQPSASVIINMIREGMNLKDELNKIFEEYIDEAGVLSVAGRRKKAIAARKYKSRLKIARKRVQRRIALNPRLKKRTARAAIRVMRNRLAGGRGKSYTKLSPQEKASIDRRVRARKSIVSKLSTRLYPTTRKKEFARFKSFRTKREAINFEFENYLAESQKKNLAEFPALPSEISYVMPHGSIKKKKSNKKSNQDMNAYNQESLTPKALSNLEEKANNSRMSLDTILKVYNEGGFNKVNEFVAKDKTDSDALFEISFKTLVSYRDKARLQSQGNKMNAKANDKMAKQSAKQGDMKAMSGHLERAKAKRAQAYKRDAGSEQALKKIMKHKKRYLNQPNETRAMDGVDMDEGTYGGTFDKKAVDKYDSVMKTGKLNKRAAEYLKDKKKVKVVMGKKVDEAMNMKKADMGDVIDDFYKSDAPQFKGKSKKKRREMAIAAKLAAESKLQELDDKTLKSYEDKASEDARKKVKAGDFDGAQKRHKGISRSLNTRLGRSVNRLKKSASELSKATRTFIDKANQREEFELNEDERKKEFKYARTGADYSKSDHASDGHELHQGGDRGGLTFSGKHPSGHSYTTTDHKPDKKAIHKAVKNHNPHLSKDDHKTIANDIHRHVSNMEENFINELDKSTLKSYIGKAQAERLDNINKMEKEFKRGETIRGGEARDKVYKRGLGVRRAEKKLKKPSQMSEAVFDKDKPKRGVQRTRHNLVFSNRKHAERTYTRMRQKQDAYKKDDPIEKKEKESIKHRRVPEYAITTKSGKVEKKPEYKEGGARSKKYGGNENPISKMDKGKPFVDPKRK